MSTNGPTSEFEYLPEQESERPRSSSGRKRTLVAAGAVAALVIGGAGAYGLMQFMSSGDSAATAVPASALGYVSLDLDPSGEQKVEAYQTMRKFPALKEQLGLDDDDDPRRWVVDAINEEVPTACQLDFAEEVEPWMGHKAAFSAVEGDEEPEPFLVLEVTDTAGAEEAMEKAFTCDGPDEEYGTATVGDFMIVAPSQTLADDVAADAEDQPLSEDDTFQARMDDAGDQGIMTGYLAPAAVDLMLSEAEAMESAEPGDAPGTGGLDADVVPPVGGPEVDFLRTHLEDFAGAAMQVRFADEGVEMEMVASGVSGMEDFEPGSTGMGDLPGTTAIAYGLAAGPDVVGAMEGAVRGQMSDAEYEAEVQRFEQETGLTFPEDVQTLLGDGLSLAVDSSIDFESLGQAFMSGQVAGAEIPAGLRIVSDDTAAVVEVTDKLEALIPPGLPFTMEVEEGDGAVAIGVDPDYVGELAGDGDLGESDAFADAMPDVEDSVGGVFVDFDANSWLDELVGQQDPEALANVEPMSSMGLSSSVADDDVRMMVRFTTD